MGFLGLQAILLSSILALVGAVSWTATPFNPASFPLAVRTPYLSAWLPQGAGKTLRIMLLCISDDEQVLHLMMHGLRSGPVRSAFSTSTLFFN